MEKSFNKRLDILSFDISSHIVSKYCLGGKSKRNTDLIRGLKSKTMLNLKKWNTSHPICMKSQNKINLLWQDTDCFNTGCRVWIKEGMREPWGVMKVFCVSFSDTIFQSLYVAKISQEFTISLSSSQTWNPAASVSLVLELQARSAPSCPAVTFLKIITA